MDSYVNEKVKSYKELKVWKKGIELAKLIYTTTEKCPVDEKFGIVSQMQRAVVSIPANIAEGWSRKSTKEFIQFLYISIGSLAELDTLLTISDELKYLTVERKQEISRKIVELQKMIYTIIKTLKSKL